MNRPLLLSATALAFVIVDGRMWRRRRCDGRRDPPADPHHHDHDHDVDDDLDRSGSSTRSSKGEFLSNIAESFDVPVQAIVELNGLADPNDIQAGQTIEIPTGVVLVADLPTTTTPTATT